MVLPVDQQDYWKYLCAEYGFTLPHRIANGGETRFHSVKNGLALVDDRNSVVGVHDGVRPFVSQEVIAACYAAAEEKQAVIPVIDVVETVRRIEADEKSVTVPRDCYKLVQTPQVFTASLLKQAYGHNDIGGIPCHASRWLLTDVVKGEFGFGGFFISDMMDMDNLTSLHFTAENQSQALEKSINAGMDMHMYSPDSLQFAVPVRQLVREGKIPMSRIDDAVRRILKVKFSLGLFENRYTDPAADRYATPDSRRTALEAARECVVLLKNEGNLLPLDTTKYRRILVTGPNADNQAILGDWSFTQPDSCVVTVLEGMRRTAGGTEIAFCNSGKIKPEPALERTNTTDPALQRKILEKGGGISDFSIREAVRMAAACDLTVVVIGGYGIRSDWGLRTYGESADRPSVDFYGRQTELVRALVEAGRPVVAVIINGKPLNNEWITAHVPAIVDAWEPGMYGGQAVAEILFGKVNPSGKMPVTVPRHAGQIPMYYYQAASRYWTGYGLGSSREDDRPAFCFGHGLSYTSFEYSDLKADSVCPATGSIRLSFRLKNTGRMTGKEVPMVFVRDCVSSVVTPVNLLKEFTKVELRPSEERVIEFRIPAERLGLWNEDMKYVTEPGEFVLSVGRSVEDIRLKTTVRVLQTE